jgi:hypothetical protein
MASASGAGAAEPIDPAASARAAIAAWTDALTRHDTKALALLYGDPVRFYGRETSRAAVLHGKGEAFARVPTFQQATVGPIAVDTTDARRLVASFVKRSGPAGRTRNVRAKVGLALSPPADAGPSRWVIVEETDDPSERSPEDKRRDDCEAMVGRVVNALPEVKKHVAELEDIGADPDSGANFGGIGPLYDDRGGFTEMIGLHTPERFESVISYDLDEAGHLTVSIYGDDVTVPARALAGVQRACAVATNVDH